jgi:hypothetical protein
MRCSKVIYEQTRIWKDTVTVLFWLSLGETGENNANLSEDKW